MGLNVLGPRKTRAVARATGLDVVHAVVQSHGDAGRAAWFTTDDHRHGVLDRHTGEWKVGDPQPDDPAQWTCRQSSCRQLFGPDGHVAYVARVFDVPVQVLIGRFVDDKPPPDDQPPGPGPSVCDS